MVDKKKKEEVPAGESADIAAVELPGSRKRLKDRYPDQNPKDDADWEDIYSRYMDETEAEMGRYKDAESKMTELCHIYPEFAELVYNMIENRMPLRAAIARVFAEEDLIAREGDDDFEAYKTACGERVDGLKKKESQSRELEANEAKSMAAIDAFCAEKGLTDEQKDELTGVINDHFTELLYKRISPEMLEGFVRQMNFDTAVADAEKTGEIRGRNAAIDAKRVKEKKEKEGDGLPGTGGGGSVEQRAKSVREFWNEGGKRTNYSEMLNKKK